MDEHGEGHTTSQAGRTPKNSVEISKEMSREDQEGTVIVVEKEVGNAAEDSLKRRLSTSGSSEDDEVCKRPKSSGSTADEADHSAGDEIELSSNEGESSSHSDGSDDSADDPQVLDDILSIKKMELLQHPQVKAFLQEKIDQAKKKGK
ncbi:unnamed protein product [Bemisia tabaci]|uniref:Uncharacterized protein n=1 Tax=Bemisia tabaci TaxID=7038 RepID=A0A9P0CGC6_BEMTA|nr:unnamed protein product [Bemisia tabaci]